MKKLKTRQLHVLASVVIKGRRCASPAGGFKRNHRHTIIGHHVFKNFKKSRPPLKWGKIIKTVGIGCILL